MNEINTSLNLNSLEESPLALMVEPNNNLINEKLENSPLAKLSNEYKIPINTRNESLKDDMHPMTGVCFKEKIIDTQSEVLIGVFPEFEHEFEASTPNELYEESDYKQFKICNEQLLEKIESDNDFKVKFTDDQIEQIKDGVTDGTAPDGYVWHHSEELGKIQLVDSDIHSKTGHTGGRTIWGGGNEHR